MKTQIFAVLFFLLVLPAGLSAEVLTKAEALAKEGLHFNSNLPAVAKAMAGKGDDPVDLKVVFSQKRIWLVADEMPMKCLKTVVKNSAGKVVLEKCFTSKCTEWFLNIEALPKGDYTFYLGVDRVEKFKK